MSTASKQRRWLRARRLSVAKALARFVTGDPDDECSACYGSGRVLPTVAQAESDASLIEAGLIAPDQIRIRRMAEAAPCPECEGTRHHDRAAYLLRGGTFNVEQAREWATAEAALDRDIDAHEAIVSDWRIEQARTSGLPPGAPRGVLNFRSRARVGRRVLDMLDGRCEWSSGMAQQGKCSACGGQGMKVTGQAGVSRLSETEVSRGYYARVCATCDGSGQNLRGTIPTIEWPQLVLRADIDRARRYAQLCV